MNQELGRMVRGRATRPSKGTVTQDVFWTRLFDEAEKAGEALVVGDYRLAPILGNWAVMGYGAAYPVESFKSRQKGLDWIVGEAIGKALDYADKGKVITVPGGTGTRPIL